MPRKFKKYLLRWSQQALGIHGVFTKRMEEAFHATSDEHAHRRAERLIRQGSAPRDARLYALTDITKATKKETV